MEKMLVDLLTKWRESKGLKLERPGITEVFLAALGVAGTQGFQCELGFGNGTTRSFQAISLDLVISEAHTWALRQYGDRE